MSFFSYGVSDFLLLGLTFFHFLLKIDTMVGLLTQPRFKEVNMALVKHHVPHLRNLTVAMLMEAVEKHKVSGRKRGT